jgi:hypothetical protein
MKTVYACPLGNRHKQEYDIIDYPKWARHILRLNREASSRLGTFDSASQSCRSRQHIHVEIAQSGNYVTF